MSYVQNIVNIYEHILIQSLAMRAKLAETLRDIGCFPSEFDPDVWLKKYMKPDGSHYWKYMLVNVDDVLYIAHDLKKDMDQLN